MNFQPTLVKIGKKTKRVSLTRYILSKVVYEPGAISEADVVCLFENQLWLERKCLQDRNFYRKFSDKVFTLSYFLKEADLKGFNRKSSLKRFSDRIQTTLFDLLVPKRNYPQWKQRFSGRFSFNPQSLNSELRDYYLKTKTPAKRVVGIGYRDKGSRRNLAKDGSPDWREIASANLPGGWKRDLYEAETIKDVERLFVKLFPDQDWDRYIARKYSNVSANSTETT